MSKRWWLFVFWLAACGPAVADPIGLACGTGSVDVLSADAGKLTVAKSCDGHGCADKSSYQTFHGGTLDMNVFAGRKTRWLVPTSLTLADADADMLVRLSEGLYAYLAATVGGEPRGAGLQSIALVPCAADDAACNTYGGFGRIGSKGIEIYYHENDDVSFVASGHRLIARMRRLAASSSGDILLHEMAHNFDFEGGENFPVHDSMHYWTAIVHYLAFVERYDSTPRLFFEYDSFLRDATAASIADDYFLHHLQGMDRATGAALGACMRTGCDDDATRAQLIAVTLRIEARAGDGFLRRFVAMTNARQGSEFGNAAERFFVVASRAARADLSCVGDELGIAVSAAARNAMATAGAASARICGTAGDPGSAFLDSGFADIHVTAADDGDDEATVVPLPVRLTVGLSSADDERALADVEIPAGHVLRMSACAGAAGDEGAERAAIRMHSDAIAYWPEIPATDAQGAIALDCESPRTLVPHRGQSTVRLRFEGRGTRVADFWLEAFAPQTLVPEAVAYTVGPASARSVIWSFNRGDGGAASARVRAGIRSIPVEAHVRTLALPAGDSSLIELQHGPDGSRAANAALALDAVPTLSLAHLEGLWHDPQKPGFGLQVLGAGDESAPLAIVSLYTYEGAIAGQEGAGAPTWLVGTAPLPAGDAGSLAVTLDLPAAIAPHRSAEWGSVVLTPDGDGLLVEYASRSGLRGYSRFVRLAAVADAPLTGTWYDPAAPGTGWNLMATPNRQLVATHYGKDAQGRAEWHFGTAGSTDDGPVRVNLFRSSGGLFLDRQSSQAPRQEAAGSVTFRQIDCDRIEATADQQAAAFAATLTRIVRRDRSCRS